MILRENFETLTLIKSNIHLYHNTNIKNQHLKTILNFNLFATDAT